MLRKLKLFDQNYHWVGEKVLPARPYDICNVTENEIAVTFPRDKKIQVFAGKPRFHVLLQVMIYALISEYQVSFISS